MKLETFFGKFDLFADAPNAVAKMRELVLQLAVQGKLVDQKQADGDAAQLITAISRERGDLAGKLRIPQEPDPVNDDGEPFRIPSRWAWTQLGNIALQIQYGYTASADPSATEIRMLRITDIQNNRVDWPSVPGCQIESSEAEKYLLIPNDILIARTGGTIGKSFIVPDAPVKSVFASYLIRVTPPRSMSARYLKTCLESPLYWTQLRAMSAGTGQPNVNGQALGRLEIPLPPLGEQKRIVAKVDELMALCDRLEAQQQEREARHVALARASLSRFADAPTPANLNFLFQKSYTIPPADLRKSILTLAVQGKLVPGLSEPRLGTLESILAEASVNGVSQGPTFDKSATEILRISAGTSRGDFYVDEDDFKHVDLPPREIAKYELAPGDLLACRFNGNLHYVGRFSYYRGDSGRVQVNPDKLIRFRIQTESNCPRYVCLAMNAAPMREAIEAMCATTAGNIGLSAGKLKTVEIPLPPLAEQRRIVAKVDQLMALVDRLETQIAATSATAANLLVALVAELTNPV